MRPIPASILQSTATVEVCSGIDRYHNQTYQTYTINRVHVQPTNEIRKVNADTDLVLAGIMFVDARLSLPLMNWPNLLQTANDNGGDLRVTIRGRTYIVKSVEELRDDTDKLHHYEIGLV